MKIAYVVLHYMAGKDTIECVESVLNVANQSEHDTKIVIVDNCSTNDSLQEIREYFKTIKYICSSLNKNIEEIINEYQITLGENKKHKIKNTSSKLIKPSKHQLIQEIYKKKVKVKNKDPYFYNKIFVFDSKFERNNIELLEKYVVEIKAINHRYNDTSIKMPRYLSFLEE